MRLQPSSVPNYVLDPLSRMFDDSLRTLANDVEDHRSTASPLNMITGNIMDHIYLLESNQNQIACIRVFFKHKNMRETATAKLEIFMKKMIRISGNRKYELNSQPATVNHRNTFLFTLY